MTLYPRLSCLLVALALCFTGAAQPVYATETSDSAGGYIQMLGNQALGVITDKSLSKDQKQAKLESIFSANVDFPWVGKFVMGRFWREATDDQKARYLKAYEKFLIIHYTSRFTDYTSGSFKVTANADDGDNEFTVDTQMQADEPNSQPVLVVYRVRKETQGYRIFDVIVEGVSLITTQRSEFSSLLNTKGIDYLIDQLSKSAATGELKPQAK